MSRTIWKIRRVNQSVAGFGAKVLACREPFLAVSLWSDIISTIPVEIIVIVFRLRYGDVPVPCKLPLADEAVGRGQGP